MLIKTLVENSSHIDELECEHGLSLYIETDHHKILFDTGQSDLFAKNAALMGVVIEDVDLLILSHGHYDHGGGLEAFLKINTKAKIYLSKYAFGEFYSDRGAKGMTYIGLNQGLLGNDRFVYVDKELRIDEHMILFSAVKGGRLSPSGNATLYEKVDGELIKDSFRHEINLLIQEDRHTFLFAGCSHKGIVNIIEHIRTNDYEWPSHSIGGFHMSGGSSGKNAESDEFIDEVGTYLSETEVHYFTCHCTGHESYVKLKKVLSGSIEYLSTGSVVLIEDK